MKLVKGSKPYSVVVLRYGKWLPLWLLLAVLGLLLVAVAGGYWWGSQSGSFRPVEALQRRVLSSAGLLDPEAENLVLQQQIANLEMGSRMDRKANETVRAEIIDLRNQIAALEEDISFYRGLMSPSENQKGLVIGSLNLVDTGVAGQFDYKLVMQQLATRHNLLNGSLRFTISGKRDGQSEKLELKDVSDTVSSEDIKLRFRYFQTIEGTLQLPEGFEPEGIELAAKTNTNNSPVITKQFGWLAEER